MAKFQNTMLFFSYLQLLLSHPLIRNDLGQRKMILITFCFIFSLPILLRYMFLFFYLFYISTFSTHMSKTIFLYFSPLMSSRTSSVRVDAIPSFHSRTSSAARLVLKLPNTSSVAPRGSLMMATTTPSMVEASSGAKYHPAMYHHLSPDAISKLTTFAP